MEAVAYYRTSSAANVGGDSEGRQRSAVLAWASANGVEVVDEFYDAAVSGADSVDMREGFAALLARISGNGVKMVLVEDPTRFARDLAVQLTGHEHLKRMGVELVPVNCPDHFRDETPTAVLIRQVLGAVAQFEKAQLVSKLRGARDRKRAATGRCEGPKPPPREVVERAVGMHEDGMSLRGIASRLAEDGIFGQADRPYTAEGIRKILAREGVG